MGELGEKVSFNASGNFILSRATVHKSWFVGRSRKSKLCVNQSSPAVCLRERNVGVNELRAATHRII